ncbi:MAG TPA: archaemetzincin family Zn-dependent metalloprotease [Nitrososphaeraceae archaeon]|jgi:archaemetzincin
MVTVMQIILQPVLFEPDKDTLSSLEKALLKELNASSSIVTAQPIKQIPEQQMLLLFDIQRNQWKSSDILEWLSDNYTKLYSKETRRGTTASKILAICDFDAYSDKLNFVFGEAHLDGRICAIYLPRIRQEFYGLKPDKPLFYQRLIKEAVHELGHAFSLGHCGNIKCAMHFSNSLSDTDIKTSHLCNVCRSHLL